MLQQRIFTTMKAVEVTIGSTEKNEGVVGTLGAERCANMDSLHKMCMHIWASFNIN